MNSIRLTRQKIDKLLLDVSPNDDVSLPSNERLLVALVLWARIQPQLTDDEVRQFWELNDRLVVPWMIRLFFLDENDLDDDDEVVLLFVRLVAQIVAGCHGASYDNVVNPLGTALSKVWDQRTHNQAWCRVDADILQGLRVWWWAGDRNDWSRTDQVLLRIVQRLRSTTPTYTNRSSTLHEFLR